MDNKDIFKMKGSKKIVVVTNRHIIVNESLYSVVKSCVKYGADYVMLREKDLPCEKLFEMAQRIKSITDEFNARLIINGNLEVAVQSKAYGVHVSMDKLKSISRDGNNFFEKLKLGASIHSLDEAITAEKMGVDYIIAGNIFETSCKRGLKGRGLKFLDDISCSVKIPVIAIGGINNDNIESVMNTSAAGAAIMSYAMEIIHK